MPDTTRLPTDMFRFAVGGRSQLYTAVLHVFGQAHERLETSLGLDEVAARLERLGWFAAIPGPDLLDLLRQLREWRLLDVTQNHTDGSRTAEEPEARDLRYSLTRHGEAALAGVEHAVAVLTGTAAQALERRTGPRRRASGAAGDFRELARWFAVAPTGDDLHLLWSTAFGLGSARHAHLAHPDPEHVPPGTSWRDASPVPVSALPLSGGREDRFSRTGRLRDVSELRRRRTVAALRERAELEAVHGLLASGGPVRLSGLGELDHTAFEFLLELIGRALAGAPDTDGTRHGLTADGRTRIALRPPDEAATAVLRTAHGAFTSPDFLMHIESVTSPDPREEEATA